MITATQSILILGDMKLPLILSCLLVLSAGSPQPFSKTKTAFQQNKFLFVRNYPAAVQQQQHPQPGADDHQLQPQPLWQRSDSNNLHLS